MKKLIALALAAMLLTALCGCSVINGIIGEAGDIISEASEAIGGGGAEAAITPVPGSDGAKASEASESSSEVQPLVPAIDESTACQAFNNAFVIYSWFSYDFLQSEMTTDNPETYIEDGNGMYYGRVTDSRASSMAQLQAIVRDSFTPEIADGLFANGAYIEQDGVLYVIAAGRGTDITKGEYSVTAAPDGDSAWTVTASVELLDMEDFSVIGYEDYNYSLEYIDGKWLFTNFDMFY